MPSSGGSAQNKINELEDKLAKAEAKLKAAEEAKDKRRRLLMQALLPTFTADLLHFKSRTHVIR